MTPSTLEFDRLTKRYGERTALRELSFSVAAGELFGFVGSNGAGKTTTMRIALGVLASDSGAVRWKGTEVDLAVRSRIGYMPEERGLYPKMKVGEQLVYLAQIHGLGSRAARAAMEAWTERLGVAERRGDEVQKLSLGNQQRVQLAAALVHDPEVLILDEPFSGLDPVAVEVMSGVLREKAAEGCPVVFSSHQLDLVERLCDRVGIIRGGEMVACGTVEALRSQGNRRVLVVAPRAGATWAEGVPGVTTLEAESGRFLVELDDSADDQALLRAALATGPVHEFATQQQTLTDLFRNVVTQEVAA
ncbi:ABC transporter ATP-binding protein [Actinoalloteichus spitiensis]|uniref:ABC transporter ATP-binding protein n=1 Tax=Actinoalloteichus spitiensis TaxID=252394 RepID=UPI000367425C|nr:ATP-binding cassette domain-containing protein [Actinoalloteichus spitiensis]